MTFAQLLALCVALVRGSDARAPAYVEAVTAATANTDERVTLLTIEAFECGFARTPCVPFGATSMRRREHRTLADVARWSLHVLRDSRRVCGPVSLAVRLGEYHTGRCVADAWSRREARVIARALDSLNAEMDACLPRED